MIRSLLISTSVEADSSKNNFSKGKWPMKLCKLMIVFVAVVIAFPVIASAAELKVGVLNLNNVFDNYDKRTAMEEDFKDVRDREEDILVEKQDSLLDLRDELQLLEQGSEARKELSAELEKKVLILQLEEEVARRNLSLKEKEYYEELYLDISEAVEAIGSEEGFDLILKKEIIDPRSADLMELRLKIGIGTVMYFSEALDITDLVTEYLNERFSG